MMYTGSLEIEASEDPQQSISENIYDLFCLSNFSFEKPVQRKHERFAN